MMQDAFILPPAVYVWNIYFRYSKAFISLSWSWEHPAFRQDVEPESHKQGPQSLLQKTWPISFQNASQENPLFSWCFPTYPKHTYQQQLQYQQQPWKKKSWTNQLPLTIHSLCMLHAIRWSGIPEKNMDLSIHTGIITLIMAFTVLLGLDSTQKVLLFSSWDQLTFKISTQY